MSWRRPREWFDGPIALSGAIANGQGDSRGAGGWAPTSPISARPSSPRTRPLPARATSRSSSTAAAEDIVYTNLFTGVHGNYLRPSIVAAGLDPDNLPVTDPGKMDFGSGSPSAKKVWRDIWGCGQGIGAVKRVKPVAAFVDNLVHEYVEARARLALW